MRPIPQFGSSNPDKNSRHLDAPSRPRFVGLLIALTIASVAPPAQARQVLLVATGPNSAGQYSVGQYDATTGGAINASFINGLINPLEFAVDGNNHLFVTNFNTTVGEYDATTGAAINANLITGLLTSFGLAVSGDHLFVTNFFESTVREYNATTGAAINPGFITGLDEPDGLTVSGNALFLSSFGSGLGRPSGNVGEYDASTGTAVNASLITGLNGPSGLAVGAVPEPSPWSIMACAGVVLLGIMLRNKHRTALRNKRTRN